nr:hypothetical protein [Tanacetum cinerariifolium]
VITKFCSERIAREIAKSYPNINYNEIIVDNCCMQLVSKPEQFDVMFLPSYGFLHTFLASDILSQYVGHRSFNKNKLVASI